MTTSPDSPRTSPEPAHAVHSDPVSLLIEYADQTHQFLRDLGVDFKTSLEIAKSLEGQVDKILARQKLTHDAVLHSRAEGRWVGGASVIAALVTAILSGKAMKHAEMADLRSRYLVRKGMDLGPVVQQVQALRGELDAMGDVLTEKSQHTEKLIRAHDTRVTEAWKRAMATGKE